MVAKRDRGPFVRLAEIILGLTFIFSGFLKGVDPWGTAIKIGDYFNYMSLGGLSSLAMPLSIALSTAEMALGFFTLFRFKPRFTSTLMLITMSFFTLFTLWIAIYNPVSDCGCFGDFIKISNTSTFIKNVVLLLLAIFIFYKYKTTKADRYTNQFVEMFLTVVVVIFIPLYSYLTLPVFDFLPYKRGTDVLTAVGGDVSGNETKTVLIYKNLQNESVHEFMITDTVWHDTTKWEYIDTRVEVLKKAQADVEHLDFAIFNETEEYTRDLLSEKNLIAITAQKLDMIDDSDKEKIGWLSSYAERNNIKIALLTTSSLEDNAVYDAGNGIPVECYNIDGVTLKSLIRAKVGVVAFDNGIIVGKWNINTISSRQWEVNDYPSTIVLKQYNRFRQCLFLSLVFLLILTVVTLRRRSKYHK